MGGAAALVLVLTLSSLVCGGAKGAALGGNGFPSGGGNESSNAVEQWSASREDDGAPARRRLLEEAAADKVPIPTSVAQLRELALGISRETTVIVTWCTSEYIPHFTNWMGHLEKLGYAEHVIVFTFDPPSFRAVDSQWPGQAVYKLQVERPVRVGCRAGAEFSNSKALYMERLIRVGVDVVYSSPLAVWINDPLSFVDEGTYDVYLASDTKRHSSSSTVTPLIASDTGWLSTGFLCFRATPNGKAAVKKWAKAVRANPLHSPDGESPYLDSAIKSVLTHKSGNVSAQVTIGLLPQSAFIPGELFFSASKAEQEKLRKPGVVVHSNWLPAPLPRRDVPEARAKLLRHAGLWLLGPPPPESPNARFLVPPSSGLWPTTPLELQESVCEVAKSGKSVILVVLNRNLLDLMANWMVSVTRLGLHRQVLVFCEDLLSYQMVESRWPGQGVLQWTEMGPATLPKGGQKVEPQHVRGFLALANHRAAYIKAVLDLKVPVVAAHIDAVWQKEPLPLLGAEYDIYLTDDARRDSLEQSDLVLVKASWVRNVCACFLYFRPTGPALKFVTAWADMQPLPRGPASTDQMDLNALMKTALKKGYSWENIELRVGMLPQRYFPPGWATKESDRAGAWVVHVDWLSNRDQKVERLKNYSLWMASDLDQVAPWKGNAQPRENFVLFPVAFPAQAWSKTLTIARNEPTR